jgi:hypothetical protein
MNRTLPPGDCGYRSGDSRGSHRSAGALPRAIGLVSGVAYPPERATPPGRNPAARCNRRCFRSGFDGVAAFTVLPLRGRHREAHFLADGSREEAAQRVRLPGSGFKEFLGSSAVGPLQQVEDSGRLASFPGVVSRASWRFLLGSGLLSRLSLDGRDVRATCATSGLFRSLSLRRCFRLFCGHVVSFCGNHRVTTSITLKALESKRNQRWRMVGDDRPLASQIASECVR